MIKIFFLLLMPCLVIAQSSDVDVKGNNNIIKVYQGNNIQIYDLNNRESVLQLMKYFEAVIPLKDIKKILQNTESIMKMLEAAIINGLFDQSKFIDEIERYVRENERLRAENEKLKKQAADTIFQEVLREGDRKLENFDNDGYQKLLDNFIESREKSIQKQQTEVGKAYYLQSLNSLTIFNFNKALGQINKALEYEKINDEYFFLKGEILFQMKFTNDAFKTFTYFLSVCKNDTLIAEGHSYIGEILIQKGQLDAAMIHLTKSSLLNEKLFGLNSAKASSVYNSLGALYEKKEMYDSALYFYSKDLNYLKSKFGVFNYHTSILYNNIGLAYSKMGNYEQSLNYFDTARQVRTLLLGPESPGTAVVYHNMAEAYLNLEQFAIAFEFENKALKISENIFGKYSFRTATEYNYMGLIYGRSGEFEKALINHKIALEIQNNLLPGSEEAPRTYSYLSFIYSYQRMPDKALEVLDSAIFITKNQADQNLREMSRLLFHKGVFLLLSERRKEAELWFAECGRNDFNLGINLNSLSVSYYKIRRFTESITLSFKAIDYLKKAKLTKSNEIWASVYNTLACSFCYNSQREKAIPYFEKALDIMRKIPGREADINQITRMYKKCLDGLMK